MRAFHQKWPLVEKSFSDCPVVPYGSAGLEKWPCICEETQLSTIDLSFLYDSVSGIHAYWCFSRSASPPPLLNWLRLVIWTPFCPPTFSLARFISGRNVTGTRLELSIAFRVGLWSTSSCTKASVEGRGRLSIPVSMIGNHTSPCKRGWQLRTRSCAFHMVMLNLWCRTVFKVGVEYDLFSQFKVPSLVYVLYFLVCLVTHTKAWRSFQ